MSPPANNRGKDELSIIFMRKSYRALQHETKNVKTYNRTKRWTPLCASKHKKHTIKQEPSWRFKI
jgi:hypothetical protein